MRSLERAAAKYVTFLILFSSGCFFCRRCAIVKNALLLHFFSTFKNLGSCSVLIIMFKWTFYLHTERAFIIIGYVLFSDSYICLWARCWFGDEKRKVIAKINNISTQNICLNVFSTTTHVRLRTWETSFLLKYHTFIIMNITYDACLHDRKNIFFANNGF